MKRRVCGCNLRWAIDNFCTRYRPFFFRAFMVPGRNNRIAGIKKIDDGQADLANTGGVQWFRAMAF